VQHVGLRPFGMHGYGSLQRELELRRLFGAFDLRMVRDHQRLRDRILGRTDDRHLRAVGLSFVQLSRGSVRGQHRLRRLHDAHGLRLVRLDESLRDGDSDRPDDRHVPRLELPDRELSGGRSLRHEHRLPRLYGAPRLRLVRFDAGLRERHGDGPDHGHLRHLGLRAFDLSRGSVRFERHLRRLHDALGLRLLSGRRRLSLGRLVRADRRHVHGLGLGQRRVLGPRFGSRSASTVIGTVGARGIVCRTLDRARAAEPDRIRAERCAGRGGRRQNGEDRDRQGVFEVLRDAIRRHDVHLFWRPPLRGDRPFDEVDSPRRAM
jgi:hypothetical protein